MSDPSQVPEIDVVEAERLAREGAVLLDVREPDEWDAGHAPSAVHVPLGSLDAARAQLAGGARVIAVCRVGGRSARATAALRSWGYDALNMGGGMQAWAAAGLPVVAGPDDAPGRVI